MVELEPAFDDTKTQPYLWSAARFSLGKALQQNSSMCFLGWIWLGWVGSGQVRLRQLKSFFFSSLVFKKIFIIRFTGRMAFIWCGFDRWRWKWWISLLCSCTWALTIETRLFTIFPFYFYFFTEYDRWHEPFFARNFLVWRLMSFLVMVSCLANGEYSVSLSLQSPLPPIWSFSPSPLIVLSTKALALRRWELNNPLIEVTNPSPAPSGGRLGQVIGTWSDLQLGPPPSLSLRFRSVAEMPDTVVSFPWPCNLSLNFLACNDSGISYCLNFE